MLPLVLGLSCKMYEFLKAPVLVPEHRNPVPPRFNERVSPAPVRTGETAVLSCISQGIPPPNYLWFREKGNGAEVVGNSERVHGRAGVLILQSARPEDAGRYVCHANNTAGSERVELEVFVVSGLSVHLTPQQVSVSVGEFTPNQKTPLIPTKRGFACRVCLDLRRGKFRGALFVVPDP